MVIGICQILTQVHEDFYTILKSYTVVCLYDCGLITAWFLNGWENIKNCLI